MTRFSKPPVSAKDQEFLRDSAKWDAIHNVTIGVDQVVRELETVWGVGRLICLVSDDTRLRFQKGHALWSKALADSDLEAVQSLGPKMIAAWRFMAREADALGKSPLAPQTIEGRLPDGTVLVVVASNAEAHAVARDGRVCRVFTIDEIGRLLSKYELANAVMDAFPGARVERVTTHVDGFADAWATAGNLERFELEDA